VYILSVRRDEIYCVIYVPMENHVHTHTLIHLPTPTPAHTYILTRAQQNIVIYLTPEQRVWGWVHARNLPPKRLLARLLINTNLLYRSTLRPSRE